MRWGGAGITTALLSGAAMAQAPMPAPGDWATYGHDKGAPRHSPLKVISSANAGALVPAWVYYMRPAAPANTADANADAQRRAEGLPPANAPDMTAGGAHAGPRAPQPFRGIGGDAAGRERADVCFHALWARGGAEP